MQKCDKGCNTCTLDCSHRCPVCKGNSEKVSEETVINILIDSSEYTLGDTYICLNRKCDVTYFNSHEYFLKNELKVPVWFKEDPNEMIVCYCRNISMKDIRMIIKNHPNVTTMDQVLKILRKEKIKIDCMHKNPLGKSCDKLFTNAIQYVKGEK
ncbi:MAG: hypothetical protein PUH11_05215 [Bacilli bacterium]|nr:hypothetical protein [Bacilli bacterium]MDD7315110.1 hypothetical protein [Bacilli bacterium]MDY4051761.1 hypothetical protein [Bacilli bacterium]